MGTPILREENTLRSSNVAMFQEHPCSQEPCHNGGRCNPQLDTYECVCLSGFSGGRCQNSEYLSSQITTLSTRKTVGDNIHEIANWLILNAQIVLVPHPTLLGLSL